MAKQDCRYSIPVEDWRTVDYNYLANNKLGYLSDDSTEYLFFVEQNMKKFEKYLKETYDSK